MRNGISADVALGTPIRVATDRSSRATLRPRPIGPSASPQTNAGRNRPSLDNLHRAWPGRGADSAEVGRIREVCGQTQTNFWGPSGGSALGRHKWRSIGGWPGRGPKSRPKSAQVRSKQSEVGRALPKFGDNRPNFGKIRPSLVERRPHLFETGHVRPNIARLWSKSLRLRPMPTKFGRTWTPNLGEGDPNWLISS